MNSISGIAKNILQMRTGMQTEDVSKEMEESMTVSFMELMNQNDFSENMQVSVENDNMEIAMVDDVKAAYDATASSKKEVSMKKEVSAAEKQSESSEQLDAYEEEIRKVLKEELGVTDAEIDEAMKTLGLDFLDLVNAKNLASLIQSITGEDVGTLFLSESFQNIMGQVSALTDALCAELGVTKEELMALFDEWKEMDQSAKASNAANEVQTMNGAAEQSTTDAEQNSIVVDEVQSTEEDKPNSDNVSELSDSESEVIEVTAVETQSTGDEHAFSGAAGDESNTNTNANATVVGQQNVQSGEFAVPQTGVQPYTTVNVSDLIEQIARNVRVTISAETTSMEMQLNPENLGKLYLHISESEGAVRAHIAAQTEVVKEALETQLVELRQTLTQQGIKVDAIEVTVATHEFEQNLEGNAKQEEQMQEQMEKTQKQARRNLNLNDLDGLTGLMSEEEALVAQIMKDNGNQVDLTA